MIRLLSLFSGIGAFESALRRGGYQFETVNYCEIDPYAAKAYSQIHDIPEEKNLHDVRKVNPLLLDNINLVTYGFPCVPEGFLIKTKNGYKNIEDVTTNDYVLTHTNTYQKVVKTMNRISDHINHVKGVGCVDLQVTDEHPVYVLRNNEFMWVKAKDLSLSDRLVFNKNTKTENTDIPDNVLWLMGRYFADGYKENHALHRVIFCIGKKKTFEFEEKIQGIKFTKYHESRSCIEYKLIDSEIEKYFTGFTTRSTEKEIPQWIIDLSKDKLIHFYNGYYSGDGHNRKDRELSMFCTVSKKMAYGLQDIVMKLFNVVPTLNIRKDKRSKTFNDSYCFQFSLRPKEQIIHEDKICVHIKNLYREEKQLKVFNFEVENDNSYTVNNVIVHNCQDISVAGKQKGFEHDGERTRSGLFFEALRIIQFLQPEYAICENVKALTSKKFTAEFQTVLSGLSEAGYNNYWEVLNAKDYGIPQNRERIFIISIRKDIDTGTFTFPEKQELKLRVKDMLEPEVDEKFYINSDRAKKLIEKITASPEIVGGGTENRIKTIGHLGTGGQKGWVFNANGISRCLAATDYKDPTKIVETKVVGNLYGRSQRARIISPEGLSLCLGATDYISPVKIVETRTMIEITEPVICRSVGRDPDNPSNRAKGCNTEQTLELKNDGMSNTLTTVQKDNLIIEPKIKNIGSINGHQSGNVLHQDSDLSPCLLVAGHVEPLKIMQVGNIVDNKNFGNPQRGRIYSPEGLSPALNTVPGGGLEPKFIEKRVEYRIRKLTPRECFRLMGFTDNDFDKIHGISNTQLYKMAGNSIVVNVLEAIFKQLFKEIRD